MSRYLKYAFGEVLLVMVGILLALQVNDWNEDRKALRKEEILLNELHQEFLVNAEQFELVVSKHREAMGKCDSLIALFPLDLTKDSLRGRDIHRLKRRWTFNPSQGIINSLVSTSSFELIRNRELRKLLVSWNDVLLDYQEDELISRQFVIDRLNPFLNKHFHYLKVSADNRLDLSSIPVVEFESIICQRREHLIDILGRDQELTNMQETIDRIVEFSDSANR